MEWTIDAKSPSDPIVVSIIGAMDLYSAPQFAQALLLELDETGRRLLIDFSNMDYLDSTGVGAIIRIIQHMNIKRGDLRFSGLGGTPKRVLEMSNIISLMKVHPHQRDVLTLWGDSR